MTDAQITEVARRYDQELSRVPPIRRPEKVDDSHVRWMCQEIPRLMADGRREKAMRWLGFVQGALWAWGRKSVEEMRTDNQ